MREGPLLAGLEQCRSKHARRKPAIERGRPRYRPAELDDDLDRPLLAANCPLRSADTWATLRLRGIGGLSGSEHNAGSIHWGFGKRRAQREQNMTMQQFPMPSSDRIGLWLV